MNSPDSPADDAEVHDAEVIDATAAEDPHADPVPAPSPEPEEQPAEPTVGELVPVRTGAVGSILPDLPAVPPEEEMRGLASLAVTLSAAAAVPKALRGKPNDTFLVLLTARDLGVATTAAMREFHVIEGKVTLSPKVRLAMVRQSGLGRIWPDPNNDENGARWYAFRHDMPEVTVASSFTWEEARLAGMVDTRCKPLAHWTATNAKHETILCMCKDNWRRYPKRMLSHRASGYLTDDLFPEIGTGLYSPDELGAVTNEEGEAIEVKAAPALPGMRGGARPEAPPEVIPADEATAIQDRVNRAKAHEQAAAELGAWWKEAGHGRVRDLTPGQATVIRARLDAVERKHGLTGAEGEGGQEGARDSESGADTPEDSPPPTAPQDGPQGAEPANGANPVSLILNEAADKLAPRIKAEMVKAGEPEPKGNLTALRDAWVLWRLNGTARGVIVALWLGFAGVAPHVSDLSVEDGPPPADPESSD